MIGKQQKIPLEERHRIFIDVDWATYQRTVKLFPYGCRTPMFALILDEVMLLLERAEPVTKAKFLAAVNARQMRLRGILPSLDYKEKAHGPE